MRNKQKDRERVEHRYREIYKPAYDAFIKLYPFTTDDLSGEVWVTVPEFEDYHESNFGRTKSFHKGKVTILKPSLHKDGYLYLGLCKGGKQKPFSVARLVATLFIPNPDNLPEVNHIDGNKFNNHVSNLEWATAAENTKHAFSTGLAKNAQGTDSVLAAVKDESDILYIRENPDGLTLEQLADMFGVTPPRISKIQRGLVYANCGGQIRESKIPPSLPEETKSKIRRLYVKGSHKFGAPALAQMFNRSKATILRIVNATSQ